MTATQSSTESTPAQRIPRRTRIVVVQRDSKDKTTKARINRMVKHPKYGKYQRREGVLHVHDEKNEAKAGDTIEIMECRPISKTKSWRMTRVIRRATQGESL